MKRYQKLIAICSAILMAGALMVSVNSGAVYADENTGGTSGNQTTTGEYSNTVYKGGCRYILGLVSWDCNVNVNKAEGTTSLTNSIWVIVANVAVDLTVIAAYLILGYVIYGGYLYICSSGDPGKVATGKKALTQAFIGLAIVMLANVILNSIRIAIGGNDLNLSQNCATNECIAPGEMITNLISWVIGIAGVVAVIFVVCGGISYITAGGDPGKVQQAKKIILYALIGLAIVGLAEIITAFVSNLIRESGGTALIETVKEFYETKQLS